MFFGGIIHDCSLYILRGHHPRSAFGGGEYFSPPQGYGAKKCLHRLICAAAAVKCSLYHGLAAHTLKTGDSSLFFIDTNKMRGNISVHFYFKLLKIQNIGPENK